MAIYMASLLSVVALALFAPSSVALDLSLCGVDFPDTTVFSVGTTPFSMTVRDLDADADPDVVTANTSSLDISILRNDGAGQFTRDPDYYVGCRLIGVDAGDIDGDGRTDVVAGCTELPLLAVLWGEPGDSLGDLTFVEAPQNPHTVTILDLDKDGMQDVLVLSDFEDAVSVIWGDGTRGMQVRSAISTSLHPQSLAVGDVNGDSRLDLAVASCGDNSVFLVPGTGGRTFGSSFAAMSLYGTNFCRLALGDLDGDSYADLAATDVLGGAAVLALGRADGTFAMRTVIPTESPNGIAIADLDGDYRGDIIVGRSSFPNDLVLMAGDGAGGIRGTTTLPAGSCPLSHVPADVDGDGGLDVVVVNTCSSTVSIGWNRSAFRVADVTYRPGILQMGVGSTFSAEITLPADVALQIDPLDVRLTWRGSFLARGSGLSVENSLERRIEVVFLRELLNVLETGLQTLEVWGCDSAGVGFRAQSQVRVLSPRTKAVWQGSPIGVLPVIIRVVDPRAINAAAKISDCRGRLVRGVGMRVDQEGKLIWDGRGDDGERAPSGIYFVQIRVGAGMAGRLVLLR